MTTPGVAAGSSGPLPLAPGPVSPALETELNAGGGLVTDTDVVAAVAGEATVVGPAGAGADPTGGAGMLETETKPCAPALPIEARHTTAPRAKVRVRMFIGRRL